MDSLIPLKGSDALVMQGIILTLILVVLLAMLVVLLSQLRKTDTKDAIGSVLPLINDKLHRILCEQKFTTDEVQVLLADVKESQANQRTPLDSASYPVPAQPVTGASRNEFNELMQKLDHLDSSNQQLKKIILTQRETIVSIYGKCKYGQHDKVEDIGVLFMKDLLRHPEHMLLGSSLNQFVALLNGLDGKLPGNVTKACELKAIASSIAGYNLSYVFAGGLTVDHFVMYWKDGLWKILRAHALLTCYWPGQKLLIRVIGNMVDVLKLVMNRKNLRAHEIKLLTDIKLDGVHYEENTFDGVHPAILVDQTFRKKVRPLAEKQTVFCDLSFWGLEQKDNVGEWQIVQKSVLLALGKEYSWEN